MGAGNPKPLVRPSPPSQRTPRVSKRGPGAVVSRTHPLEDIDVHAQSWIFMPMARGREAAELWSARSFDLQDMQGLLGCSLIVY